jgi:hypothetical protein
VLNVADLHMPTRKVFGKHKYHDELHHIPRLERKTAEIKPTPSSIGCMAEDWDKNKE